MGPNCGIFFRNSSSAHGYWGLIWGVYMMIYVLNGALVYIGPVMAVKSGFTK